MLFREAFWEEGARAYGFLLGAGPVRVRRHFAHVPVIPAGRAARGPRGPGRGAAVPQAAAGSPARSAFPLRASRAASSSPAAPLALDRIPLAGTPLVAGGSSAGRAAAPIEHAHFAGEPAISGERDGRGPFGWRCAAREAVSDRA
jgi:hypothetical protein